MPQDLIGVLGQSELKEEAKAPEASTDKETTAHLPSVSTDRQDAVSPHSDGTPKPEVAVLATEDAELPALDVGVAFFFCDGYCFSVIPNNAEMYRCSYCIADFCAGCHDMIKANNMTSWSICGSTHEHIRMPPIATKYRSGVIMVGDGEISLEGWLQKLKEDWGYGKP